MLFLPLILNEEYTWQIVLFVDCEIHWWYVCTFPTVFPVSFVYDSVQSRAEGGGCYYVAA